MATRERPRVVIVGSGFGGLWAARTLANTDTEVLLLDRNNYHTFLALLYQVGAAELYAEDIVYPIRSILWRRRNVKFIMANVVGVDLDSQVVATTGEDISYDYLVLATGSVSNFYNIPGAEENSFSLKTLEHGVAIRNHIICCFERASHEDDPSFQKRLLTFTIIGGGATGVEYAGALAELIQKPLRKDYPTVDFNNVKIILLEGSDRLLPGMTDKGADYTAKRLKNMGVEVRFNARVERIEPDAVYLKDGQLIPTETAVWTAGVRGHQLAEECGLPLSRDKRVLVEPTLQVPGYPNVYVLGDLAYIVETDKGATQPLPYVAQVAIQTGKAAARNILNQIKGEPLAKFDYWDKGMMVTIGRNAGAVHTAGRTFTGFVAWLAWIGLHIFYLIGFRNRIVVMLNWAWDYLFFQRPVRFVFPADTELLSRAAQCAYGNQSVADRKSECLTRTEVKGTDGRKGARSKRA